MRKISWWADAKWCIPAVLIIIGIAWNAGAQTKIRWISTTNSARWVDNGIIDLSTWNNPGGSYAELLPETRYQTIDGWGGCFNELGWVPCTLLTAAARTALIKEMFDTVSGSGYSLCRIPIGASDFSVAYYSLNDNSGDNAMSKFNLDRDRKVLIPYIKAAMQYNPNIKVWGSPWTPPSWLKSTGKFAGGSLKMDAATLNAYALYLAKTVAAFQAEGIKFYAVHVQNEPDVGNVAYPCCVWTSADMLTFVRDYLGPYFTTNSVKAEIWLGCIRTAAYDYEGAVLGDARAKGYIKGVGYQYLALNSIPTLRRSFPDMKIIQTENGQGSLIGDNSNTWAYSVIMYNDIINWVKNNKINAYCNWNMILDETGKSGWGWAQNASITINKTTKAVTYNPSYYVIKHFSRYVRPGAVLIGTGGNDAVGAAAFRNTNGDLVITYANEASAKTLAIKVGTKMASYTVPANSFNTFVLTTPSSVRDAGIRGTTVKRSLTRVVMTSAAITKASRVFTLRGQAVAVSGLKRQNAVPKVLLVQDR